MTYASLIVVCFGTQELCAAVLFASTDSVDTAAASSWDKWNVLPMARPASKAKLGLRTADPSLAAASSTRESQAGVIHSQPSPTDRETYIDRPETGARDADARGGSTSRSWTAIRELATTKLPAGLKNAVAMAAMKGRGNGGSSAARGEIEIDEGEEGANTIDRRTERDDEKVGGRKNASAVRPYSAPPSSLDIQHSKGDSNGQKNAYNGGRGRGGSGGGGGGTSGTQRLIATEGRTQQRHQKGRDPSTRGHFSMMDRDDNIISRPQYSLSSLSSCSDEEGNREVFTHLRTQEKRRNAKTKQQRELGRRSFDGSVTRKRCHGLRVQAKQLRHGEESKLANTHAGGGFAVLGLPAAVDRNPSPAKTATNGELPGRISDDCKREKIAPSSPPINSSCTTKANVDATTADEFPAGRHHDSCNSDAVFERQSELSPLSSPEGLRNLGSEAGEGIFVEVTTTARSPNGGGGGGSAMHCGGWGDSTAPRTQDITDGSQCGFSAEDDRGNAVGGNTQYRHQDDALDNFRRFDHDDDAAVVVVTNLDRAPEALCERHHMVAARGTDERSGRLTIHADMKSSEVAMAAAPAVREDEGPPCDGGRATRITVVPNEGRMGGEGVEHDGSRVEEARRGIGEQQKGSTGGRDQAKRLALEVAQLRSALRGKQADLDSERATRGRLEVRPRQPHP